GNKHVASTSTPTPRAPFTRDIFGATLGGPIFKDRLFVFGDYQGGRYHSGGVGTATVLTAKERHGDFSELLDPSLMCSQTGGVCASNARLIRLYNATAAGSPIYANNQLPSTPLNPPLVYLLAHP